MMPSGRLQNPYSGKSANFRSDVKLRQNGETESGCGHLMNAVQAGALVVAKKTHPRRRTDSGDLTMQMMTMIKGEYGCALKMAHLEIRYFDQRMIRGRDDKQPLTEKWLDFECGALDRKRSDDHVQRAARKGQGLIVGNPLAHVEAQIRHGAMQQNDEWRHQVGAQGWADTEPQYTGKRIARSTGEVAQVGCLDGNCTRAIDNITSDWCQFDAGRAPLDEGDAEAFFKSAQLLAQRRL